jgi:hypothetical protein
MSPHHDILCVYMAYLVSDVREGDGSSPSAPIQFNQDANIFVTELEAGQMVHLLAGAASLQVSVHYGNTTLSTHDLTAV